MQAAYKLVPQKEPYFEIRLNSVVPDVPLAFDLYLLVNHRPTLFRRAGETVTSDRMKLLVQHGGEKFLVPDEQRSVYLESLKSTIRDPGTSKELKSKILKESAFLHVHDLFTKEDISEVVTEAKSLVEEMVTFVTSDMEAVSSLMRLSVHDYYTYNHCVDVGVYSIALAKRVVGENKEMLIMAGLGGLLHDIGKRSVALELINKPGSLTKAEWEEVKRHPEYGKAIVDKNYAVPEPSKLAVYEHHENYDGTGYPQRLKGDEISLLSRITTIADVFDALTTKRSYHDAITATDALNTMVGMQPGKFDPDIFSAFNKKITQKHGIELSPEFDPCSVDKSRIKR